MKAWLQKLWIRKFDGGAQPDDYKDPHVQAAFNTGHSAGYATAFEAFVKSFDHESDCECSWCRAIQGQL